MANNILKIFYGNKVTGRADYNFDIKELTENFSLYDFVNEARKRPGEDFGGFLICTPKQYIFGYNGSFGTGSHGASFGRAMKDIEGGGIISDEREAFQYASKCEKNYFCGRLIYESVGANAFGRPVFDGRLVFMTGKRISPKMFESFKKFYEDYKNEIDSVIKNLNGSFHLMYYIREKKRSVQTFDLSEVYNYLESQIDYDMEIDTDEQIIGVSTTETRSL